jgi:hypothetical protein
MNQRKLTQYFVIVFIIVINVSCKTTFNLNIKSNGEMLQYEKSLNSIPDTIINYGILKNPDSDLTTLVNTKTYIFHRTKTSKYPNIHVWYHYDFDTKQLLGIKYTWENYNPGYEELSYSYLKNEKLTLRKYKSLKNELNKKFGKPTEIRQLSNDENRFAEETWWINDSYKIQLYVGFNKGDLNGLIDFLPELEMMITYKNK